MISPLLVFLACALGAVGVAIAIPRRRLNSQPIGAILAGAAAGVVILALSLTAFSRDQLPNLYFYVFGALALGGALRMITHPRPVYAALYFILTIIASSGLFLILSAEFMAFALIIIYAGAILITYLFVLMLATQAPVEEEVDRLADYDSVGREPVLATLAGFALLAVLTTLLFGGASSLEAKGPNRSDAELMAALPQRTEAILRDAGLLGERESLQRVDEITGELAEIGRLEFAEVGPDGDPVVYTTADSIAATEAEPGSGEAGSGEPGSDNAGSGVVAAAGTEPVVTGRRAISLAGVPGPTNVEGLGYNLLYDHPGAIEIAGVILLMAMIGAVVLSRRQIEIDEAEKRQQARLLADRPAGAGDPI